MFSKILTSMTKYNSAHKNKAVSLKSLNLYSSDSDKKKEDKKLYLKLNHFKNTYVNQNFSRKKIKKKYYNIFKKNLSSYNLFNKEDSKNISPKSINIDKIFKKNLFKTNNNNNLYKLKHSNNIMKKINKSNSYLNIKEFSTINSSFFDKNTTLSSKRKTFYLNQNKIKKNRRINGYTKRENKNFNSYKNIFKISPNPKNENKIKNIMFEKRKKYPFIYNSDIIMPKSFDELPESIVNFNKKFCTILNQENISVFAHSFNIINKGKFSPKFESPWDYLGKYHIINQERGIEKEKEIVHGKEIIKDLNKIIKINECKSNKFFDTKKQLIYYKFRQKFRELIIIFKTLMIPLSEIIYTYKVTNYIFNYEKTHELIFAIKANNFDLAFNTLIYNKYLVLDIDQFYMTPLHYAAKYNFYKLIPLIIGYGGYVNAKNCYGETPLMICVKKNFYESILLLFLNYGSPFMNFSNGKKLKDICNDFKTNFICEKIKDIYIKNLLIKPKNFYNNVKNEITCFIVNECQGYIKSDCFEFIQNKIDYYKFNK